MPVILVVDDSELNRQIAVERLAERGFVVAEAADGAAALREVEARRYDLVLLDIMMPGLDGISVLRRIRELYALAELPVIMATARGDRADVVEALQSGANDYVVKPLDFAVVGARIETQLAIKAASDTMRAELSAANARAQLRRQEMLDRGIDILHICPNCGRCYDQRTARCGSDGWALDAPRLLPFRIRGRYRFVRTLSSGGMSALYEAHDEKLDRAVAVKLIKPEHFDDPTMRVRFEQEARAVARIDHPGVVSIYDSGDIDDGTLFFVMELLRGMNLGQVIRRYGPGAPRQVAALARQLGAAIGAAHRAGFIHRDIKPENIYLMDADDGFRVKLLDFGITKPIGFDPHVTQTGTFIGTPAYMAPEQLRGEEVDVRADVYALAAVLYEALTGRRVVDGVEADELFAAALAKNPADRPTDAEAWASRIDAALSTQHSGLVSGWPAPLGIAPPEPAVMSTQRVSQ
ncbi:MAG TPA: response regulator [Thermoanaerobaculia bacterium]|nr:response regulator [Thermoanaerobaculia bacterium]